LDLLAHATFPLIFSLYTFLGKPKSSSTLEKYPASLPL
jgi:hypothetical protein